MKGGPDVVDDGAGGTDGRRDQCLAECVHDRDPSVQDRYECVQDTRGCADGTQWCVQDRYEFPQEITGVWIGDGTLSMTALAAPMAVAIRVSPSVYMKCPRHARVCGGDAMVCR